MKLNELTFVSTGICPGCHECMREYGYITESVFEQAVSEEVVLDEGSFSWSPCEVCNTSLGGNSYLAHGFDKDDNLIHFRVCIDCFYEINS